VKRRERERKPQADWVDRDLQADSSGEVVVVVVVVVVLGYCCLSVR